MFSTFYFWYVANRPWWKGWIFKTFLTSGKLKIGTNFRCDTFPHVLITQDAKIEIGNDVTFRRDVELRAHNDAILRIGNNCRIDRGVRLLSANDAELYLADGTRIGLYTVVNGGDSVTVGRNSLISGFAYLQTSMHRHESQELIQDQGYDHAPITLGHDVWIGTHAVIMPGIQLGDGAIVGSNAVVTKSVKAGSIVGGVPAKVIKERR